MARLLDIDRRDPGITASIKVVGQARETTWVA